MKSIGERMKALGPMSPEDAKKAAQAMLSNLGAGGGFNLGNMGNMAKAMSDPEIRQVLESAMTEYAEAMPSAFPNVSGPKFP